MAHLAGASRVSAHVNVTTDILGFATYYYKIEVNDYCPRLEDLERLKEFFLEDSDEARIMQ